MAYGILTLDCRFLPFITLNVSCHSLLACRISVKNQLITLWGIPLYVICCFSPVPFNVFYLYLVFVSLINMCLGVFLFGFILYGLSAFWTWLTISFPILGKFLTIISSNIFSSPFSFFSFFWYHYNSNVGAFYVVPESLRLSSFLFIHFSLFCSMAEISYHSVFQVTYPFFCLRYSAIGSFQYVFHFSYYSSLFVL